MGDTRLRELERRFRATGAPADEAAWLLERVRVGALSEERLRRAAAVGHPAARVALGDAAPALPGSGLWEDMHEWAQGFRAWERPASLRVALAAVEAAWRRWEPLFPPAGAEAVRTWLRVGREWAECPCSAHELAARQAADRIVIAEEVPPGGGYMLDAAGGVARMAGGNGFWVGCIANSRHAPDGARLTDEVMAAIREEVGPWLLTQDGG